MIVHSSKEFRNKLQFSHFISHFISAGDLTYCCKEFHVETHRQVYFPVLSALRYDSTLYLGKDRYLSRERILNFFFWYWTDQCTFT